MAELGRMLVPLTPPLVFGQTLDQGIGMFYTLSGLNH
jgi:hypothetical protein